MEKYKYEFDTTTYCISDTDYLQSIIQEEYNVGSYDLVQAEKDIFLYDETSQHIAHTYSPEDLNPVQSLMVKREINKWVNGESNAPDLNWLLWDLQDRHIIPKGIYLITMKHTYFHHHNYDGSPR